MSLKDPKKRVCRRCKCELPIELFVSDKRRADGYATVCKECRTHGQRIVETPDRVELPEFDGTAEWVINAGAKYIAAMARNPSSTALQASARAFSQVASAIRGYMQRKELEVEVSEMRKQVIDLMKASEYGQGIGISKQASAGNEVLQ